MEIRDGLVKYPFTIIPEDNPDVYFAREKWIQEIKEHLLDQIFANMPLRAVFWGPLRIGKTQLAYHIKYLLEKELQGKIIIRYLKCPSLHKRSTFDAFLQVLFSTIGKGIILDGLKAISYPHGHQKSLIEPKTRNHDFKTRLNDVDIDTIVRAFDTGREDTLWRWLCGNTLSNTEMDNLGTGYKRMPAGKAILFVNESIRIQNTELLILLDEAEQLSKPIGNPRLEYTDGLRELTDETSSIGTIFFETSRSREEEYSILYQDPLQGRIGGFNYFELPFYTEADVFRVVKEAVKKFRDAKFPVKEEVDKNQSKTKETLDEALYPITKEAIDKIWEKSNEMKTKEQITVISPNIVLKTLRIANGRVRRLCQDDKCIPIITSNTIEDVMSITAFFSE